MSTFSLDLIEKDFVHYWLMSKNSSLAPSTFIDISNGFRAKFESENLNINLDFLVCPQAVVNNIVLGQVFGDPYYFALPETLSQTVHPTSRRFVFDMEQSEFLEFHWYTNQNMLLTIWLKFVTDTRLMSYFVMYDMTGNKSRRPQRVIQSKEIVLQKQTLEMESGQLFSEAKGGAVPSFLPSEGIERRLEAVPQAREFVRNLLGFFEGFIRTSEFELNTFKLLKSSIVPCKIDISCREPSEDLKLRERSRWCMRSSLFPSLPVVKDREPVSVVHKLMQCTISDMERLESFFSSCHFQTLSPPNHSIQHVSEQDKFLSFSQSETVKPKSSAAEKRKCHMPRNPSMRMQQRYEATERELYDSRFGDMISSDSLIPSPTYTCSSETNEVGQDKGEPGDCYLNTDFFSESTLHTYGFSFSSDFPKRTE